MIVFAILTTDRDAQFARVYSTYNPQGLDPLDHRIDTPIRNASVIVSSPLGSISYRDTILQRSDSSRYQSSITAFVASPFRARNGESYSLAVSTPLGSTSATITVPLKATISYTPTSYLDDPVKARGGVTIRTNFSKLASGYWFRFLLSSQMHQGGNVLFQEDTIPVFIIRDTVGGIINRYYSKLEKATGISAITVLDRQAYIQTLRDVLARHPSATVIFKQVKIEFTQFEENVYKYYSVVNGFSDPQSIRVDAPDFSNLPNAHGIFGAYCVDTIIHELPDDFPFNQYF